MNKVMKKAGKRRRSWSRDMRRKEGVEDEKVEEQETRKQNKRKPTKRTSCRGKVSKNFRQM